jgi:hypothetical protein
MHHAFDSIHHAHHVEIHQQAQMQVGQTQVSHELGIMNSRQLFHCLQFEDKHFVDQQVDAKARIDMYPAIDPAISPAVAPEIPDPTARIPSTPRGPIPRGRDPIPDARQSPLAAPMTASDSRFNSSFILFSN